MTDANTPTSQANWRAADDEPRSKPVGWVERSDTHHVVASTCLRARMTDYRRNFIAGGSFFFERLRDVQQGNGFRKGSTHPTR